MARAIHVRRGRRNNLAGLCAEDGVERLYRADGAEVLGRRLRTPGGELDIVAREDDILVFVEVKRRARLDPGDPVVREDQWRRLEIAANHYMLTAVEMTGAIRGCRFDVAIVGHDGTARLVKNARSFDGNRGGAV